MCLHHSISTDINSDRTRAVVKVCVDKKPKKLNILVHSKREIILKKEQEIAVENLILETMFLLYYQQVLPLERTYLSTISSCEARV